MVNELKIQGLCLWRNMRVPSTVNELLIRLDALVRKVCLSSKVWLPEVSVNPLQVQSGLDAHCPPVLAYPLFRARSRRVVPVVRLAGKVGANAEDAIGSEARHLDAVLRP